MYMFPSNNKYIIPCMIFIKKTDNLIYDETI